MAASEQAISPMPCPASSRESKGMSSATPTRRRRLPAPTALLIDLALPAALFYGLRAYGVDDVTALVAGMVPPLLRSVYTVIRQRRIDPLGALILAGMVISLVTGIISDSPRQLLIRNAWVSAPLSLWTLATLWARRPIQFTVTRELMPARAPLMDHLWETDAGFRRAWRHITIVWGVLMLVDAGLRIVISMTLPIGMVPVIDTVISIVTVIGLQLPTHLIMRRTGYWWEILGPPERFARRPPHRSSIKEIAHVHAH